jgi:hypothetical protein
MSPIVPIIVVIQLQVLKGICDYTIQLDLEAHKPICSMLYICLLQRMCSFFVVKLQDRIPNKMPIFLRGILRILLMDGCFCFFFFPSKVDDGPDYVFDDAGISKGVAITSSQSKASRSWYVRCFPALELPSPAIVSC